MSAFGRLWRRAPTWRLCLFAAITFSALTALFPPSAPSDWVRAARSWAEARYAGVQAPAPDAGSHYTATPATGPLDYSTMLSPAAGPDRKGILAFAGRQLPLLAGAWQEVVLARSGGPVAVQVEVLDRVEADHLTGLVVAAAPGPLSNAAGRPGLPELCIAPDTVFRQIMPATEQSPLDRECWTLSLADMTEAGIAKQRDDALARAVGRLHETKVAVPSQMLALRYYRSDAFGWVIVAVFVPDRRPAVPARRAQDWARQFSAALHAGFDGTLTPAKLTADATRDP